MTDFNPSDRIASDFQYPAPSLFSQLTARVSLSFADYAEGLDLSHWRANAPLADAKANGIRFIITKATQGDYFIDELYEPYRKESQRLSLPFTGYHYWDAAIKPLDQGEYYDDHTGDDHSMLDVIDVEKYGNQGVLSQDAAAQSIHDTAEEIQQRKGREVMVYTNRDSWTVLTGNSPIIATFPLWVAHWTGASQPTLPIGANEWVLWQYTNQYKIPGYQTNYDGNRYNGNEGAFEAYLKSINGDPPGDDCCEELLARIEAIEQKDMAQDADIYTNASHLTDTNERVTELERKQKNVKDAWNA